MAKTLSATCVAIAQALTLGTLVVSDEINARLGISYVEISDSHGLIEVALDRAARHRF